VYCFKLSLSGDGRVNEWSGLAAIHTIFVREHNRIEQALHYLNPHWSGERLYQEVRRIINAIWQIIVYKEYLPSILGNYAVRRYGLQLADSGYWNG